MTQAELADRIGVTRQTVIAIEQGRYSPSLEMAFQIAQVFGVPLDDVFQVPNEKEPRHDRSDRHRTSPGVAPATLVHPRRLEIHRAIYRLTRGRFGFRRRRQAVGHDAADDRRPSRGQKRQAILGYFEDGPNLVTMAMNGWGEPSRPGG